MNRKTKKFSATDKALYKLGYLNGQAKMKKLMLEKTLKKIEILKHWVSVYHTGCNYMAAEVKRQDRIDKIVRRILLIAKEAFRKLDMPYEYSQTSRILKLKYFKRLGDNEEE